MEYGRLISMSDPSFHILRDLEHLTLLILVLGLGLYAVLRPMLRPKALRLDEESAARLDRFNRVDLVAVLVILVFYYLPFVPQLSGDVPAPPTEPIPEAVSPDGSEAEGRGEAAAAEPSPEDGEVEGEAETESVPSTRLNLVLVLSNAGLGLFFVTMIFMLITSVGGRDPRDVFGLTRVSFFRCALWTIVGIAIATPTVWFFGEWVKRILIDPVVEKAALQEVVESITQSKDGVLQVVLIVNAIAVAPILEEFIFRGYIYGVVRDYTDRFFACLVTAMLFALVHVNLAAIAPLFLFAIFLTFFYEVSGSLWVAIGIHAGFNAINVFEMVRRMEDALF